MTFWRSEQWRTDGRQIVTPFEEDQVENASYELTLGGEAFVTGGRKSKKTFLDRHGDQLIIPPGQFALLLTHETVEVPADALGFISIKSRFKINGLVNVSGFHVDPGFRGQLIFAVYNASGKNIIVSRGARLFLLWIASLQGATEDLYKGTRNGQDSIPDEDIMALGQSPFSPAAVNQKLGKLEIEVKTTRTVLLTVVGALLVILITRAFTNAPQQQQTPVPRQTAPTATPRALIPSPIQRSP